MLTVLLIASLCAGLCVAELQTCNYESTDVYIVFEASESSTEYLGGIDNYLQQVQDIARDALTSSPDSRVSLTAFTALGPREYVAINTGLTSSQVSSTVQAVSTTQLGGDISDALSFINSKRLRSSQTGNRVVVAVIFTSSLNNRREVRRSLNSLTSTPEVDVQVFPVGVLAYNSASGLPFVQNVITNLDDFGQAISDVIFQCEELRQPTRRSPYTPRPTRTPSPTARSGRTTPPQDADSQCSGWHGGEAGLFPLPGRCDKFYQCSYNKAFEMQCPFGQLFDKEKMACDHAHLVLQSYTSGCDYCQSSPSAVYPFSDSCEIYYQCGTDEHGVTVLPKCCPNNQAFVEGLGCQRGRPCARQNYTHHGSCRNYLQCVAGGLAVKCCPEGQAFDQQLGYCSPGVPDCFIPCDGEKPVCEHKEHPDSICRYMSLVHDREIPRVCPDRHAWDQSICDCSASVTGAENCGVQPETCEPDFITNMDVGGEWGFTDDTPTRKYIGNDGVQFPGDCGVFADGAYLTVYHFQNINWPKPVWARVDFQYSADSTETEVLLSNGCYNDDPGQASLAMYIDPTRRTFSAGIKTNETKVLAAVQWIFNTSPDTWLQGTMRYDGYNLDINLKDPDVRSNSVSESVPASGQIQQSPCAMRVGRGNYGEPSFNGNIDEIIIYTTCSYPDPVDY